MEKKDLFLLLRKEKINEFNEVVKDLKDFDLKNVNLRGRNLTHVNFKFADLRGAYLANSNLKGVNLSHAKLEGASLHRALISGAYFPKNVSAQEVLNTVNHGTRIRTTNLEVYEGDNVLFDEGSDA